MTPATEKEAHMGHGEWTQRRVGCQGWVQIQKYQLFLPVFDFKSYVGVSTVKKKKSTCTAGDTGLIPGLGRLPREGHGNPTPVFLPGKFHGQRSLVGCSPWGHKELDMTEVTEHARGHTVNLPILSHILSTVTYF